ncbi:MAG: DUF4956 domain-containing protein [Bacteroidia bacterium]|nr:DUF4956 domain-containing protein [Bacteroidia bacterium]
MEFLGIPIYDDDIFKLLFRFATNLFFLVLIVRVIYYSLTKRGDYLFALCMINIMVFLICFTLKKFELQLGMALGLFALFGILRYRTSSIPIREMSYLFVIIGIGVVNALANGKMSYVELGATNFIVVGTLLVLEKVGKFNQTGYKNIHYGKLEMTLPARRAELIAELKEKTGLDILEVKVGDIDLKKGTAELRISFNRVPGASID